MTTYCKNCGHRLLDHDTGVISNYHMFDCHNINENWEKDGKHKYCRCEHFE